MEHHQLLTPSLAKFLDIVPNFLGKTVLLNILSHRFYSSLNEHHHSIPRPYSFKGERCNESSFYGGSQPS